LPFIVISASVVPRAGELLIYHLNIGITFFASVWDLDSVKVMAKYTNIGKIGSASINDLELCKPVITSIWTIRQTEGQYQELHTHPAGNISGNIYISAPDLQEGSAASDSQLQFRLPQTRDINRFIMVDTWKYTPTPGTVILFPSHLPHTVYPWKGDGHRTVMAFDARLVPKDEVIRKFADGQS
jgi:hypothetical protein